MVLKNVQSRIGTAISTTKRVVALMCVWGLIFSMVTIGRLAVAFDYDDTLVASAPSYEKAYADASQPYTPQFWSIVNRSYDLERPKAMVWAMAWLFKVFGFRVTVLATRPETDGEPLKKEWRKLVARGQFIFTGDKEKIHSYLQNGNYLLYFGDGDSDITQAQKAKVFPIRVLRGKKPTQRDDYHPGTLGELVIPFSEY